MVAALTSRSVCLDIDDITWPVVFQEKLDNQKDARRGLGN